MRMYLMLLARFIALSAILIFCSSVIVMIYGFLSTGSVSLYVSYWPTEARRPFLSFISVSIGLYIMTRFVDRRPFLSLGLALDRQSLRDFLIGWILQLTAAVGTIYLLLYLQTGLLPRWLSISLRSDADVAQMVDHLVYAFPVPIYEEALVRGYLLQMLLAALGRTPAILLSSLAFGMMHYLAYGWGGVMGGALSGILLAVAALKTRSLWLAIGLHWGINSLSVFLQHFTFTVSPTAPLEEVPTKVRFGISDPVFSLHFLALSLLIGVLPLRPSRKARILWDRYVQPAPWPPWRRAKETFVVKTREEDPN